MSEGKAIYGHKEHEYADAFANALRDDPDFRHWVLDHTPFAGRDETQILCDEMIALRPKAKAWWKNYFTEKCRCFGCSGSESDIFVVIEDRQGGRFALHIEVKQPTDRFDPAKRQGERYRARAACWAKSSPRTAPAHDEAATLLLCSESKQSAFAQEILHFDATIAFEAIARKFPNAVTVQARPSAKASGSSYNVGDRVEHKSFGYGTVAMIEGNKLEIDFETTGRKRVMDSFVSVA